MDPDIRPQDDLFGHVNGRWLDETEIPADRSSWGPFVQLADAAEQQVRAIIEELAERAGPRELDEDARKIGDLYALVHGRGDDRRARPRAAPAAARRRRRAARRPRPGGVPREFERHRRRRPVRLLRRHRRPRLRPLPLQHRPGRARAARRVLLPRRQVRRDPREVRRLPRRMLGLAGHDDPAGGPRRPCSRRDPARRGPLGARRDPRRHQDLQPDHLRRARGALPGLRLGRLRRATSAAADDTLAEVCVRQPSYLEHLSRCSTSAASRTGGTGCSPGCSAPPRRTSPTTSSRPTSTSTAAPSTARPSCGPAGSAASRWSRARSARPSARSTSPGTSRRQQGADGRPGRQPARGLPAARSPPSTG